jgi:hypothetical protein
MADNSQQLLDDVLAQQRQELAPESSEQDYFELFCAEQVLKDYDLSHEEVQAGIVDGEHDGGVDSAYAVDEVSKLYEALGSTDAAAKGPDLRKQTIDKLTAALSVIRAAQTAPA